MTKRILTEVGEVGVHVEGAVFKLRPSLYAISQLGSPKEIVEKFALVMHDFPLRNQEQLIVAAEVIYACAEDDMPAIFGELKIVENRENPRFVGPCPPKSCFLFGQASEYQMLQIARSLLRHGVIGDVDPVRKRKKFASKPDYMTEFVARDHVATAVAHLGYTEADAWEATMTAIVAALKSKYPADANSKESFNPPSVDEMRDTMKKMKLINAVRQ